MKLQCSVSILYIINLGGLSLGSLENAQVISDGARDALKGLGAKFAFAISYSLVGMTEDDKRIAAKRIAAKSWGKRRKDIGFLRAQTELDQMRCR